MVNINNFLVLDKKSRPLSQTQSITHKKKNYKYSLGISLQNGSTTGIIRNIFSTFLSGKKSQMEQNYVILEFNKDNLNNWSLNIKPVDTYLDYTLVSVWVRGNSDFINEIETIHSIHQGEKISFRNIMKK